MNNKITKESWELIVNEIINIVEINHDDTEKELKEYLEGEGIITVVND